MQGDNGKDVRAAWTQLVPLPDPPRGAFRAHGEAIGRVQDRLVFFEITGPFNKEFFQALETSRRDLGGSHRPRGPFANIVTVRGSLLMTPEAIEVYSHYVKGIRAHATAHVVAEDVIGRSVMVPLLERLYREARKSFDVFLDVQSAVRWAELQLSEADAQR